MNIYLSGSLAYDRIMNFPGKFSDHILPEKIHILNVCFMVDNLELKFGGTAGNIAYNLAFLEELPTILATAGNDFERYLTWLKELGIAVDHIKIIEGEPTASAYITTDSADNQITGFNPGAMKYSSQFDFQDVKPEESIMLISPGNLEDMKNHAAICKERGIRYILDPGQSIPAFSKDELREMIDGSELLISNDYELDLIKKTTKLNKKNLLTITKAILTTLGDQGAEYFEQAEKETHIPAVKVDNAIDPTGAGDAFRAGVLKALVLGKTLAEGVKMGATCASFCVEQRGTQAHTFTCEEFWERYREQYTIEDTGVSEAVHSAQEYYESKDAHIFFNQFYFTIWGGEDMHLGIYRSPKDSVRKASQRTVERKVSILDDLDEYSRVVDLGAGIGGSARYLAKTFGCKVVALNLSAVENQRHRIMNQEQGLDHLIDVLDGNFESIPYPDEYFDVVWSEDAMLHSGDRAKVLEEAARVLKKGGEFIFTDPMQSEEAQGEYLEPILDRIALDSLATPSFYQETAEKLGFELEIFEDHTQQLVNHYGKILKETELRESELENSVSRDYIKHMKEGLKNWVNGGKYGQLICCIF